MNILRSFIFIFVFFNFFTDKTKQVSAKRNDHHHQNESAHKIFITVGLYKFQKLFKIKKNKMHGYAPVAMFNAIAAKEI